MLQERKLCKDCNHSTEGRTGLICLNKFLWCLVTGEITSEYCDIAREYCECGKEGKFFEMSELI